MTRSKTSKEPGRRLPTLADVAKEAEVSAATISRLINSSAYVSPQAAKRVRNAIMRTGYVANAAAGELAANRSKLVAIVVPGLSLFGETVAAIVGELNAAGFSILLSIAAEGARNANDVILSALARRPSGLILTGSLASVALRRAVRERGLTVIETWDMPGRPIDIVIGFSHYEIGKTVAEFVIQRDRRRPLLLTTGLKRAGYRVTGFLDAWEKTGRPKPVVDIVSPSADGRERLAFHFASGEIPDVVVCSSDLVALGVLFEAKSRGLRVPEDLGIIGFGGTELRTVSHPTLTTVRIDGADIGRRAAAVFIGRSKGREPPQKRIDVGFELLVGESL